MAPVDKRLAESEEDPACPLFNGDRMLHRIWSCALKQNLGKNRRLFFPMMCPHFLSFTYFYPGLFNPCGPCTVCKLGVIATSGRSIFWKSWQPALWHSSGGPLWTPQIKPLSNWCQQHVAALFCNGYCCTCPPDSLGACKTLLILPSHELPASLGTLCVWSAISPFISHLWQFLSKFPWLWEEGEDYMVKTHRGLDSLLLSCPSAFRSPFSSFKP